MEVNTNQRTMSDTSKDDVLDQSSTTVIKNYVECLNDMRNQLFTLYKHPMNHEHMKDIFNWVSCCCIQVGNCSWISADQSWNDDDCKLFILIARISLNELSIAAPLLSENVSPPNLNEEARYSKKPLDATDYDNFATHLIIVESVVKSLVTHEVDDRLVKALKGDELKNLLCTLKETIGHIIGYLEIVHRYWSKLTVEHDSEPNKLNCAKAALRIVCVWFSECPGTYEPECKRFLLDLIVKNLIIKHEAPNSDLFILALHSICVEDNDLLKLVNSIPDFKPALEGYLSHIEANRAKLKEYKLRCGMIKDLMLM